MFNFEKLDVWQKAIAHAGLVYRLTRGFPTQQVYDDAQQIGRMLSGLRKSLGE